MKNALFVISALILGFQAHATQKIPCPNLQGDWACVDSAGQKSEFSVDQKSFFDTSGSNIIETTAYNFGNDIYLPATGRLTDIQVPCAPPASYTLTCDDRNTLSFFSASKVDVSTEKYVLVDSKTLNVKNHIHWSYGNRDVDWFEICNRRQFKFSEVPPFIVGPTE